jgi:hypothetical protein
LRRDEARLSAVGISGAALATSYAHFVLRSIIFFSIIRFAKPLFNLLPLSRVGDSRSEPWGLIIPPSSGWRLDGGCAPHGVFFRNLILYASASYLPLCLLSKLPNLTNHSIVIKFGAKPLLHKLCLRSSSSFCSSVGLRHILNFRPLAQPHHPGRTMSHPPIQEEH